MTSTTVGGVVTVSGYSKKSCPTIDTAALL